jgi:hypothetical protein
MTWGGIDALGKPVVIQEENTSPKTAIPLKESRDLADNRIGGMWETREDEIKQNFETDPLAVSPTGKLVLTWGAVKASR